MPFFKLIQRVFVAQPLLASVGLSTILFFYSTGFYDYWLLTWLAPLPICLYSLQASFNKTAIAAFLAYCLGAMNQSGYLPLPIFTGTTALNAAVFAADILLFRKLSQSGRRTAAPLTFAAGWTAYEFLRSHVSSFGTFESLAYTQVLNLPVLQLAYFTGLWGITFLLMLLPASVAILWRYRQHRRTCRLTALITGSLVISVVLFGVIRLYQPTDSPVLKIGLTTIPTTRELLRSQDDQSIATALHNYSLSVDTLANAGVEFILLPEKLAALTPATHQAGLTILSEAASKNKVTLIAGLSIQEDQIYNTAAVFTPDGKLLQPYHKQHLLPAYESKYTPGTKLTVLNIGPTSTGGIAICKDMDFVQPAREYSRNGAGILFVPALDFHDDGWLHARIAVMRGVEGNYAVARTAQWGLLTVSDSHGRLLGVTDTDTASGEASLLSEVPLGKGRSFYSQTGDWLAYLCLLLTIHALHRTGRKK